MYFPIASSFYSAPTDSDEYDSDQHACDMLDGIETKIIFLHYSAKAHVLDEFQSQWAGEPLIQTYQQSNMRRYHQ